MYEGINVKVMMEFLSNYPAVSNYLPDECECYRLPREWIGNLGVTVVGKAFKNFIRQLIEERN